MATKKWACPDCNYLGVAPENVGFCSRCKGLGIITTPDNLYEQSVSVICPTCQGSKVCRTCGGSGTAEVVVL